jgi:hypothetical protein
VATSTKLGVTTRDLMSYRINDFMMSPGQVAGGGDHANARSESGG